MSFYSLAIEAFLINIRDPSPFNTRELDKPDFHPSVTAQKKAKKHNEEKQVSET